MDDDQASLSEYHQVCCFLPVALWRALWCNAVIDLLRVSIHHPFFSLFFFCACSCFCNVATPGTEELRRRARLAAKVLGPRTTNHHQRSVQSVSNARDQESTMASTSQWSGGRPQAAGPAGENCVSQRQLLIRSPLFQPTAIWPRTAASLDNVRSLPAAAAVEPSQHILPWWHNCRQLEIIQQIDFSQKFSLPLVPWDRLAMRLVQVQNCQNKSRSLPKVPKCQSPNDGTFGTNLHTLFAYLTRPLPRTPHFLHQEFADWLPWSRDQVQHQ